ncbi:hypothetical protein [Spongiimicrobium sp. 3-5]|uniref:hypothetical protein n=1 Tax=Spongiimicrobium sp. 3-5 TaxID=3332596 RepID=UPI003980200C
MKTGALLSIMALLSFTDQQAQESGTVQPALPILSEFSKVRDFTLSANTREAYVTVQSAAEEVSVIVRLEKENDVWTPPQLVSFSGKYKDLEPFLSPDGLRLYFVSNRPLTTDDTQTKDFDIWFVTRNGEGDPWSEPQNLGSPINTEHNEFYPSLANNGNLYYTSDSPTALGKDDIFFSEFKDGKYNQPIGLGATVNTEGYEYNAYIAPNESFLIFGGYNREDGLGSGDLYISFQKEDDSWEKAVNMGEAVNSAYMDYCPFVAMDSYILYFTSRRSTIKSEGFKSIGALQSALNTYANGNSRIYKVSIKDLIDKK